MTHDKRRIFVRNLSFETNDKILRKFCEQYGEVEYVHIAVDIIRRGGFKKTNEYISKGYGFVTFREQRGAWAALNDSCAHIDGREVQMFLASTRSQKMFPTPEEEVNWLLTLQ